MLKRIHVNQHNIRANARSGNCELPVMTVKTYKSNTTGRRVDILNDDGKVIASFIYSPDNPLSCGARLWVETRSQVVVDGEEVA